jgi:hypothetical protein
MSLLWRRDDNVLLTLVTKYSPWLRTFGRHPQGKAVSVKA